MSSLSLAAEWQKSAMNFTVNMLELFGSFCSNGEAAAQYRVEKIEPELDHVEVVVFDFLGVRNMNSSFCNALISGLVAHHPEAIGKIRFVGCRRGLDVLIRSAVEIGLKEQSQFPKQAT